MMLKRLAKLLLSAVFWFCRACANWSRKPRLVVLTYHQVRACQKERFKQQLRMLKRAAQPVFADFLPGPVHGNYAAVTFDDFYEEALTVALPLLCEQQVPSTWFIPSGFLGLRPGWITRETHPNFTDKIGGPESVKELDASWIRVGSHTATHPRLPSLDAAGSARELSGSRESLSVLVGKPVDLVSLPYGEYSPRELDQARSAGYRFVFTNVPVWTGDRAELLRGRVPAEPTDWPCEFWLKLRGGYDWLAAVGGLRQALGWRSTPSGQVALSAR